MARSFQYSVLFSSVLLALSANAAQSEQVPEPVEKANKEQAEKTTKKSDEQDQVEIIEVKGVKQADLKARELERLKSGFSSVIATDDLGNFVDQNVAESLRRLPGVTLQRTEGEGKFVTVRGLGPGFVSVNMNGSELSGAGDDRKVGLDALPADLLGSIEVLKTLTPDQNLNSIGGTVNVNAISAFDRGKNTLKFKAQDAYNDRRKKHSPKFSLDGTHYFLDETLGIGFAASTEDRKTLVDEDRHHSSGEMQFYQADIGFASDEAIAAGPQILGPRQLEVRRELADRSRDAAAINIEYKPSVNDYFYFKGNYTKFTDDDVALREYFDFQDAGGVGSGEIAYVNPQTQEFILTDIDVFHQYFIQESETEKKTFSVGGKNTFAKTWTLEYEYAKSKSEDESIGDRRVQFRERDLIVYGRGGRDHIDARVMTPEEAASVAGLTYDPNDSIFGTSGSGDAANLSNWAFDNLFLEDGYRVDDLQNYSFDLQKDINNDWLHFIKVGASFSERTHTRDKDRASYDPDPSDCGGDQACLDVVSSNHADYASSIPSGSRFSYPFVNRDDIEHIAAASSITRESATMGELSIDSTKEDYKLNEDTKAVYIMAQAPLGEDITLIGGVRWVETKFSSTGFLSLENDDFEFNGAGAGRLDIAVPLPESSIKYSEYFPSLHLRYEPTEDILVRGAIWTSFTRPSFKQARGFAKFDSDIELCPPDSDSCDDAQGGASVRQLQDYLLGPNNLLEVGNPNLLAMTSTNYDASIGWYPSEDLFMEAAIFYKDIDNFIVDVAGIQMSLEDLPLSLPVSQVTEFVIPHDLVLNNVNITINGQKATVKGIELSYNQYFNSGLFVQSNLTLLDSEAKLNSSIRADKVPLPDQADTTFNLAFGWENKTMSFRLIGNYRSDILEEVGSCPEGISATNLAACKTWADRYQDEIKTLDFKAKYKVNDQLSLYFDAINLTGDEDLRYFKGADISGGNVLYQKETYGKTYQLGMTYKFY
ncbi:TonB-dependent receptor [Colwellia sp. MEBiC06753]